MNRLGIFAKYWQPGRVKTRLAQSIGKTAAADVYRAFLDCLVRRFGRVGDARTLVVTPPEKEEEFQSLNNVERWAVEVQSQGDLGQRMARFFQDGLKPSTEPSVVSQINQHSEHPDDAPELSHDPDADDSRLVLIGSDSPNLPASIIQDAFDQLRNVPVVLGPSEDGGYYLIGMSRFEHTLFDQIPWSTDRVFDESIARLQNASINYATLAPWYDVDELDDLHRLFRELEGTKDSVLAQLRQHLAKFIEA